ncbi:MAG: ABC transporter substrate-binding protein [Actinomycetota bacterium]|nr:ABC transporter substrate-binding protein [Actinomycetota bacterium]
MRIAISTNVNAQAVVAQDLGYFTKFGIKASLQNYATGVDGLTAVLTGQADIGGALAFPTLNRLSSNGLGIVATSMRPKPGFYQLALRAPLSSASQLAGKRVGIIAGTDEVYATYELLRHFGVDPSRVDFVDFPDLYGAVAALQGGQVDATLVYPPGVTQAAAISGVHVVPAPQTGIEPAFIVASRSMLTNHRKIVAEAMAAMIDANRWMAKHMRAAAALLGKFVQAPASALLQSMLAENYTVSWQPRDAVSFNTIANFLVSQKLAPAPPALRNYLDLNPLRSAVTLADNSAAKP